MLSTLFSNTKFGTISKSISYITRNILIRKNSDFFCFVVVFVKCFFCKTFFSILSQLFFAFSLNPSHQFRPSARLAYNREAATRSSRGHYMIYCKSLLNLRGVTPAISCNCLLCAGIFFITKYIRFKNSFTIKKKVMFF